MLLADGGSILLHHLGKRESGASSKLDSTQPRIGPHATSSKQLTSQSRILIGPHIYMSYTLAYLAHGYYPSFLRMLLGGLNDESFQLSHLAILKAPDVTIRIINAVHCDFAESGNEIPFSNKSGD